MRLTPGVNRRHRRASHEYVLILRLGVFDLSASAKAAYNFERWRQRLYRHAGKTDN